MQNICQTITPNGALKIMKFLNPRTIKRFFYKIFLVYLTPIWNGTGVSKPGLIILKIVRPMSISKVLQSSNAETLKSRNVGGTENFANNTLAFVAGGFDNTRKFLNNLFTFVCGRSLCSKENELIHDLVGHSGRNAFGIFWCGRSNRTTESPFLLLHYREMLVIPHVLVDSFHPRIHVIIQIRSSAVVDNGVLSILVCQ